MKILRTASLGSNFTGSYKKSVPQQEEGNHYSVIKGVLYSSLLFYFLSESPIFYQVINKIKLYFSKTKFLKH